jgi:hypothetical protein
VRSYLRDFTRGATPVESRTALAGAGYELFKASPSVFRQVFWDLIDENVSFATIFIVSESHMSRGS